MKTKDLSEIQLVVLACNSKQKKLAMSSVRQLFKLPEVTKATLIKVFSETKHDVVKGYLQNKLLTSIDLTIHEFRDISKFKGAKSEFISGMQNILLRNEIDPGILVALSTNNLDNEIARRSISNLMDGNIVNPDYFYEVVISSYFEDVAILALRWLFILTNIRPTLFWRLVRKTNHEFVKKLAYDLYIQKEDSDNSVLSSIATKCSVEGVSMRALKALVKKADLDTEMLSKIANTASEEAVALFSLQNLISRDGSHEKLIKGVGEDSIFIRVVMSAQEYLANNIGTSERTLMSLCESGINDEISISASNTLYKQVNTSEETFTYLTQFAQTKELRLLSGKYLISKFDVDTGELLDILRTIPDDEKELAVLISDELFSKADVCEIRLRNTVLLCKHFSIRLKALEVLNSKYGLSDDSLSLFSKEDKTLVKHIKSKYLSNDNMWHAVYSAI